MARPSIVYPIDEHGMERSRHSFIQYLTSNTTV
jgi:hypothetical protein